MTNEGELLAQAQSGDTGAFAGLVSAHRSMVFGAAYNFLRNAALAEEIAQDVFLELYRSLGAVSCPEHLRAWLCRTVLCRCIDNSRRRKYRAEVPISDYTAPRNERPEPHDVLASDWVRRQIANLPEGQRAVLILRYQEDFEPGEIAEMLDLPVNTVKSRLHRALESVRSRMPKRWKYAV